MNIRRDIEYLDSALRTAAWILSDIILLTFDGEFWSKFWLAFNIWSSKKKFEILLELSKQIEKIITLTLNKNNIKKFRIRKANSFAL